MNSIRTLLVDEDVEGASSLRVHLASARGASFAIKHRRTLHAAVSRMHAGNIDVVLLDPDLPDSSGVDSVVRLQAAAPEVPIVVVTDCDDDDLAVRALQAGAQDYLVKSRADQAVLQRTILHALERHRAPVNLARSLSALEKSEARFRNVVATNGDGVAVVSREGLVLFANPAAARLVGRPPEELHGEMLGYPFAPRGRRDVTVGDGRIIEVHVVESEWDGSSVWLVSLFDVTQHKRSHADLEDVTARMRSLNVRLERLASIDPLTELLNRRGLDAELRIELRRKSRTGAPLAAVLLDCDDFKSVNDALGHAAGDVVLKELADRLKESLRPSDHIGRIGGDEFMILLPDTRFAEAFQVAERMRLSISDQPLPLSSGSAHVTASLGIELVSDEIRSIDEVLLRTQVSLQHGKRNGKNRVSTQHGGATNGASDSEDLAGLLQEEAAFRALRQPIVQLSDESAIGWEIVPRGPAGIFEMPRDFLRLALEHGILTQVDLNCLRTCVRNGLELPASSRCHVNILPSTLLEASSELLLELFAPCGPALRLCIEISEQHLIGEPSFLRPRVRALKEAGILVAIDDVGFGRTSLEALILLEPDLVKIDQKFVHGISRDAGWERALQRMVGVVASLGSELVVEGIESREDVELLLELGVPYGQGALWGPPA